MAAIAMVLTVFNACTKDELKAPTDAGIAKTSKADVYLENGYLAFKNMNAVDSVMNVLGKMSRQEKDAWEQKIGLKSARYEFDKLFDEYEKLASKEEFQKFKAKYTDQLKFNEMDETDCSIDYPYESTFYVSVMNNKGIFKVGLSLCQYTSENQIIVLDGDMNKLENLDAYSNDKNVIISSNLKSGDIYSSVDLISDFAIWNPIVDGGRWWVNPSKDRELLNELRIDKFVNWNKPCESCPTNVTKSYRFYLRQHALKKSIFGWNNYSTIYEFQNCKAKVGSGPTTDCPEGVSPQVSPYMDWSIYYYETNFTYSGGADLNFLQTPMFSMQGMVWSRGMYDELKPIMYKEHAYFP